jgi:hypothetical protein
MALVHALAKVSIELIAIYFHSLEIFLIQIEEMAFCKPDFIIIKSNYFRNAQKAFALVREWRFRALVRPHSIARTSISHTVLCGREMPF